MVGKTSLFIHTLSLLAIAAGLVACHPGPTSGESPAQDSTITVLPPPAFVGAVSLEELLAQRRSVRQFDGQRLTIAELSQLLWAAQGISDDRGYRTAPSAGALYPLEIYVATEEGVFHYLSEEHGWQVLNQSDVRQNLYEAALRQDAVRQAPVVFAIAAVYERTAQKYGGARSPRYVHLEAGHAAQNLLLQAVALDLGAVPIGAFDDRQVQDALGLQDDHEPLYLIAVGHPQ
jgi:SagB-type dehydrogenase family enzyme